MGYKELSDFDRAIVKGQLGKTTQYLGTLTQGFKQGVVKRMMPITNLMRTEKTWRACRGCRHNKTVVVNHINGMLTAERCKICNGAGVVYN